jgi:hypothetical protein
VPHSAKRALPSAITMTLGKAGKPITNFTALPSARALTLGKEISKIKLFVECKTAVLSKEI